MVSKNNGFLIYDYALKENICPSFFEVFMNFLPLKGICFRQCLT